MIQTIVQASHFHLAENGWPVNYCSENNIEEKRLELSFQFTNSPYTVKYESGYI